MPYICNQQIHVSVKPNEQSQACLCSAMARKRNWKNENKWFVGRLFWSKQWCAILSYGSNFNFADGAIPCRLINRFEKLATEKCWRRRFGVVCISFQDIEILGFLNMATVLLLWAVTIGLFWFSDSVLLGEKNNIK